jgi:hypothetical protein
VHCDMQAVQVQVCTCRPTTERPLVTDLGSWKFIGLRL